MVEKELTDLEEKHAENMIDILSKLRIKHNIVIAHELEYTRTSHDEYMVIESTYLRTEEDI